MDKTMGNITIINYHELKKNANEMFNHIIVCVLVFSIIYAAYGCCQNFTYT